MASTYYPANMKTIEKDINDIHHFISLGNFC